MVTHFEVRMLLEEDELHLRAAMFVACTTWAVIAVGARADEIP